MKKSRKTGGDRKRKAAHKAGGGLWKTVDVGLPETGTGGEDDDNNHYDNSNLQNRADKDLDSRPGEEMGIFLGLEVIDGNDYRVENRNGSQILVFRDDDEKQNEHADEATGNKEKADSKRPKKKQKTKQDKGESQGRESEGDSSKKATPSPSQDEPFKKPKKKRKKKKKKSTNEQNESAQNDPVDMEDTEDTSATESLVSSQKEGSQTKDTAVDTATIARMQTAWMAQTGGVTLHEEICTSLIQQNFWTPTPIQAGCLPAAVLGRRNIVGAAPTGSGKTLAFLLPMYQSLLEEQDKNRGLDMQDQAMRALILTPTRELAKQIVAECDKLGRYRAALVVGGLAHVKQKRLLSRRPPIVVATPGRLWEMMSSNEYQHLNELSKIKYLVIDEADRMIQMGSFPQLSNILDAVQMANPMDDEEEEEGDFADLGDDPDSMDRLLGLPGIRGEARVTMLTDDILKKVNALREEDKPKIDDETVESDDESVADASANEDAELAGMNDEEEIPLPAEPPVDRQTFVFSATLTLPATNTAKPTKKRRHSTTVGGAIAEILDRAHAKGKTKVVDLATNTKGNEIIDKNDKPGKKEKPKEKSGVKKSKFQLPPGLQLHQVKCTQKHKDSHLYAYLMTTTEGSSGPCLVFCNSIACVRRVGKMLQTLGLDVRILHAQMQQRARFKAIEKLRDSKTRTIVVATDVAARGIDIESIRSVVHYDVARTVGTFVHRAGRTARGMGAKASGHSFSLVAPAEDKAHASILSALNTKFENLFMDGRLLREAQERVNLATKVVLVSEVERQASENNQWFKQQAGEAGLELDEDLLEEGMGGGKRDRAKVQDAKIARERLSFILAQPMQTQRHGKFLSTNSAAPSQLQQINQKG